MTDNETHPTTRILVLPGSLRSGSVNRRLADVLRERAPEHLGVEVAEGLDGLPFYDDDLDGPDGAGAPDVVRDLRERVAAVDHLLVLTPEHNGTIPAVISNAIAWLSRPYGQGAIRGKGFAAVGVTPTPYGGKWAHEHARHSARIAGADVVDVVLDQSSLEVDVLGEEVVAKFLDVLEVLAEQGAEGAAA